LCKEQRGPYNFDAIAASWIRFVDDLRGDSPPIQVDESVFEDPLNTINVTRFGYARTVDKINLDKIEASIQAELDYAGAD